MTPADDSKLAAEFRVFARHIAGAGGTPYQQGKYLAAHQRFPLQPRTGFEKWMLGVARAGGPGVWLADSYSGFLARKSVVRSKLVLALALLECAPPSFIELDRPNSGGQLAIFAMALKGMQGALGLLLGALIFAPLHIWSAATGPRR